MLNIGKFDMQRLLFIPILFFVCSLSYAYEFNFVPVSSNVIPTNEVRILSQDSDGYIWIPTYNGLIRYDGIGSVNFGINEDAGTVFNSYLNVVAEDKNKNLWIAAEVGVFMLDKKTGDIEFMDSTRIEPVNASYVICADNGDIWVAARNGVYRKKQNEDNFIRKDISGVRISGATFIMEDNDGNIWVTAWENGLFKYDRHTDRFYKYFDPVLYYSNIVYQDRSGTIWVGTWDKGLLRLKTPDSKIGMEYDRITHSDKDRNSLLDDIIYFIYQDSEDRLWICSRSGLSLLADGSGRSFINFIPGEGESNLPYNDVSSILQTKDGQLWLSMFGGGVCRIVERRPNMSIEKLANVRETFKTSSIRSIYDTGDGKCWMGLIGFGAIRYDRADGSFEVYSDLPDFSELPYTSTIDAIIKRSVTSEICFGTYSRGLWLYDVENHSVRALNSLINKKIPSDVINTLYEDSSGNIWAGTRAGAFILTPDDDVISPSDLLPGKDLSVLDTEILGICDDSMGNIWLATLHSGIVRLNMSEKDVSVYYLGKRNDIKSISCLFADSNHRVWAGSVWNGLSWYDRASDRFNTVSYISAIDNKGIYNITEDLNGKLWVTTVNSVYSFNMDDNGVFSDINCAYVGDDSYNFFLNRNANLVLDDGTLLFGGTNGILRFSPEMADTVAVPSSLVFTDLKVNNVALRDMAPEKRRRISEYDVNYTDRIRLSTEDKNITIEFALLNYADPKNNVYSYMMEGYDNDWIIADALSNSVSYTNLSPGRYVFRLKAADADGIWTEQEKTLSIRVYYRSWWVFLIYCLVILVILYFLLRFVREKVRMRQEVRISKIEKMKAEEINHVKLKFFTNVTHELMTPLSIIIASIENLRRGDGKEQDNARILSIMSANATRLMRLIQQVLEFRKAESENLKIRVSNGDIAAFARNCVETFKPLTVRKRQQIEFRSDPESVKAWFDTDKIDKILYNLLSNASKYTPECGNISVTVDCPDECHVRIEVTNSGELMSQKVIDGLFKRFYEGDYRRYNTIGTGIGLSLVKSLVTLHKGTITVTSKPEYGNRFSVVIPVCKSMYSDDEIEKDVPDDTKAVPLPLYVEDEFPESQIGDQTLNGDYTLLIVDDNEELLMLLSNLMSNYFEVKVASDGETAMQILENGNIDLVISDIMMPGMNGIELCRRIKEKFETCHIPVILLTAKNTEESQIEGFTQGADGYVTKPCNFSLLYAQVVNCLKRIERKGVDFRKQLVFDVSKLEYTTLDEEFLKKAIDCCNANFSNFDFGLNEFVKEVGTSRTVLTEKLKSLTGLTPNNFILNVRLTAACKILSEHKKIRISDLAYSVGFNDPKYFSTCFKKKYGMTPKKYYETQKNTESD